MEGSEIFLDALFDWNLKDQNGRLRRNGRVGEDMLHSRRAFVDASWTMKIQTTGSLTISSLTRSSNHALAWLM